MIYFTSVWKEFIRRPTWRHLRIATNNEVMKTETKELMRLFGIAILVMVALPLVYRGYIYFWPPEEKPHQTLTQFLEEVQREQCLRLLTKPVGKWSDAEVKLEPEIYAWLKEQGNEILPWEWTEEARRKDPKGHAKCWRRIWKERSSHCERRLAEYQEETKRLDRELQIITTIHTHRTNQIARLRTIVSTNTFPCQVALERIEKGRFWGWNKRIEFVECEDLSALMAATNSVCSKETEIAQSEIKSALALSNSISSSKEKSALFQKLCETCDQNKRLIENESAQDEFLRKSLIETLKAAPLRRL